MEGGEQVIESRWRDEIFMKTKIGTRISICKVEVKVDDIFRFNLNLFRNMVN